MQKRAHKLLISLAVFAFAVVSQAKTEHLSGKMVAYDLMRHASKSATFQQNQEVVIFATTGQKEPYAKVVFSSFGTTQIDPKYFDGSLPFEADVVRDHSCDESAPRFVPQASLETIAGRYLLTDAYKSHAPAKIKRLKCYAAIFKKK